MQPVAALLALIALCGSSAASAQSLTDEDFRYLQTNYGITRSSAVIAELTPNEAQALHSAIDDLKSYPDGRNRAVQSYLALVYGRECKRWARDHPGEPCSPPADAGLAPGKAISDHVCAECHLFGTPSAPSFHQMADQRDWNAHKVSHALQHNSQMVPVKLTPEQLDQLAAYINSLR
jgi:hypothetical protein